MVSGVDVSSGGTIQIQKGSRCEVYMVASQKLLSRVVPQGVLVGSDDNSRHAMAYGINVTSATSRLLSASTSTK